MAESPTEAELEPATGPLDEPLDEPAEPEELNEPELEGEPELEPEEQDDGPSSNALLVALEREHTRHEKAVAKALGIEPAAMNLCPTCEGVGFTPEPLEKPPELVQDPFTETCMRCRGNGATLSGATRLALYEIPCNGCGGSGYVSKPEQPEAGSGFGNGTGAIGVSPLPPTPVAGDVAAVAELRARGYTVLEPIVVPAPAPV